jgi:hypothetical protein
MSVAVGFDDGADGHVRANVLLYRAEVFPKRSKRNFGPGPPVESERALIGQNDAFKTRGIHKKDYSDGTVAEC